MAFLVGSFSLVFVLTFHTILAYLIKWLRYPLLIGVFLRIAFVLIDHFVMRLPDHGSDALNFHLQAISWSQNGFVEMLSNFPGPTTYFYAWVLAFFYSILEPSVLLAQAISVFLGGWIIVLSAVLAKKVAGRNVAVRSAWLVALFPTLILYSSIPLREPFLVLFFLIAVYGAVSWSKYNSKLGVLIAFFGFFMATFFHGAFAIGALGFLGLLIYKSIKQSINGFQNRKLRSGSIVISAVAPLMLMAFIIGGVAIPKLGSVFDALDANRIIAIVNYSARDVAAYPSWTQPNTPVELLIKSPIRVVYFLFSPFPWDVSKPQHLIGLLDGFFYLVIFFLIFRKWRDLSPEAKFLLLIAGPIILAFALAIGNFGTGVRHRAKFAPLFLIVCSVASMTTNKKSKRK